MFRRILVAACGVVLAARLATAQQQPASIPPAAKSAGERGDITGVVTDSSTAQPLTAIEITVKQESRFVSGTFTDAFGHYTVHNLAPGTYAVTARMIGYRITTSSVTLGAGAPPATADFRLEPAPVVVGQVEVTASAPTIVDVRSGDQTFQSDQYNGAPTTTTSQIVQQSLAGAARAPTGEVHIRGQHAEYTYYVDGVPVTSGVSGSLNELFDPAIINHIDFKTGGWDAEFGNRNAAIIDIATRIPSGGFHLDASGYGGSFNSNGQSISASMSQNKFGGFVSGSRQVTDMRLEPVLADPATTEAINFHNHGEDYSAFAKLQYISNASDLIGLDANWSQTHFDVPYDSTGGVTLDDKQKDVNDFAHVTWRHRFGAGGSDAKGPERELFGALFYRDGSLAYTPGANDDPSFVFFPDTTLYNLHEDRSFNSYGAKADYVYRPGHDLELKAGVLTSGTSGHEKFVTTDAAGQPGPASDSDLNGSDFGIYAQGVYSASDRYEIRPGVRYDSHNAPFLGTVSQVSPRIRLSVFPNASNSFWLYYGRLFMPTNIEDLRAITSVADSGVVAEPTKPERDDFYEAGYVHSFPVGVVTKLSGYYKRSKPGMDDNTVPGSAIVTTVNLADVWITGIEAVVDVKPPGPLSGYLNFALNHAYGRGPVTGGFFPADTPEGYFDLDHDQRVSAVASATYSPKQLFVSATGIWGSGLTNGADPDASYGTGLFDFNRSIKVSPNFIMNASAGYTFYVGKTVIKPEVYVDNVFDNKYLLKGAFFSGPSVGRPRSAQAKVTFSL